MLSQIPPARREQGVQLSESTAAKPRGYPPHPSRTFCFKRSGFVSPRVGGIRAPRPAWSGGTHGVQGLFHGVRKCQVKRQYWGEKQQSLLRGGNLTPVIKAEFWSALLRPSLPALLQPLDAAHMQILLLLYSLVVLLTAHLWTIKWPSLKFIDGHKIMKAH